MTSRPSYKPEGWPTAEDLALMSSQDVREHEEEIDAARKWARLIALAYMASPKDLDSANQRLVVAYRALKAWEAERG